MENKLNTPIEEVYENVHDWLQENGITYYDGDVLFDYINQRTSLDVYKALDCDYDNGEGKTVSAFMLWFGDNFPEYVL